MSQRTTFPLGLFFPLGLSNVAFFRGRCQLYANKAAYSVKCSTHLVPHFLALWEQDSRTSNLMYTPRNTFQRLSIAPVWLITCRRPDFTSLASFKPPENKYPKLNPNQKQAQPERRLSLDGVGDMQNTKLCVFVPAANPYLHNASRTNKTSSSGIVREAQREASTDVEKATAWRRVQRGKMRGVRWRVQQQAVFLCCQVTSGERFGVGV